MILKIAIGLGIGAAIGGVLGMSRSCETGACPLTASPWRGAFFGGVMGLFVVLASISPGAYSTGDAADAQSNDAAVQAFGHSDSIAAEDNDGAKNEKKIESVTDDKFYDAVDKGVVLVDFWAPWCGPCRQQLPILEDLNKRLPENARIVKINVDDNQRVASKLGVRSIPTLILFADGEAVDRFVGVQGKEKLLSAIENAEEDRKDAMAHIARNDGTVDL